MGNDVKALLSLLEDKKALLKYLLDTIERSEKYAQGLRGMKERGFSQEGMLDNLIKVTAMQSEQIKHLALIALITSQGDNFSTDVAMMAMKLGGDPREALSSIWKNKFKG